MSSLLSRIALLVGRRPRTATLAVVLAVVAIIGGAISAGSSFKDDFTVPGIESQKAQDLLEQRFPASPARRPRSSSPARSIAKTSERRSTGSKRNPT